MNLGNIRPLGVGVSAAIGAVVGGLFAGRKGALYGAAFAGGTTAAAQALQTDEEAAAAEAAGASLADAFTGALGGGGTSVGGYGTAEPAYVAAGSGDPFSTAVPSTANESAALATFNGLKQAFTGPASASLASGLGPSAPAVKLTLASVRPAFLGPATAHALPPTTSPTSPASARPATQLPVSTLLGMRVPLRTPVK